MWTTDGKDQFSISGGGLGLGFAFGGTCSHNLILFGEAYIAGPTDASYTMNGASTWNSSLETTVFGMGPGLAYYFESNAYVSATVMMSQAETRYASTSVTVGQTDWGYGLSAVVGREWWVSDNWGLGIAALASIASMPDGHGDMTLSGRATAPTWTSVVGSIVFSATFN